MHRLAVVPALMLAAGCVRSGAPPGSPLVPDMRPRPAPTCCLHVGLDAAARHRLAAISSRRFTHAELWRALGPTLRSPSLHVTEIARSMHGRPIRAVTFGTGETTVLLWSQMHGDESTATMALADLLGWMAEAEGDSVRERIRAALRVVMVPMLNPDGAELFQRENAAGVDVNRDARRLATPEARALKALRDSLRPDFGFNLHDQGARTLAGPRGEQVAIALLAPAADAREAFEGARADAGLVAATIARVLADEIPGRIAKYDEGFNPRAFGDLMQSWGTRTVLIESGALRGDPQKQRLRTMNVVAILSALDAIASGAWKTADPAWYDALPTNARQAYDLIIRGGTLVMPSSPPIVADLAFNFDDPLALTGARLREVGDLSSVAALDTLGAVGLFIHPDPASLTVRDGARWLRVGSPVTVTIRRGAFANSPVVRRIGEK
jgi:hypothetical protein